MAESPEDRLRRRLIRKYDNEALVDRLLETPDGRRAMMKARSRSMMIRRGAPMRTRRGTASRIETPRTSATEIAAPPPLAAETPWESAPLLSAPAPRRSRPRATRAARGNSVSIEDARPNVKKRALADLGYISLGHRGAHAAKGKKRTKASQETPSSATGSLEAAPVQGLDPLRGLPPGWYRDPSDPSRARFWDGAALGNDSRPIAVNGSRTPAEAYQGLPVGWYRDEDNPRLARYWDGVTLSEERGLVAE